MIVVLEGCPHSHVALRARDAHDVAFGTCTGCYTRLRSDGPYNTLGPDKRWLPDAAAAPCPHTAKVPVAEQATKRLRYRDALCVLCGVVLRHPDGPGDWEEVIFNGYLIEEDSVTTAEDEISA